MEMTKWEPAKHMGRNSPERRMWRSGCEGEKGQLSENGWEGECSEEPTPVICQRALQPLLTPTPTWLCRITLFQCPLPPPHSPLLQELAGSRVASKRGNSKRVMVWCGQGRAGPGDRSPPGACSRLIPPWGRDAEALQGGEGRQRAARQGQKRACRPH